MTRVGVLRALLLARMAVIREAFEINFREHWSGCYCIGAYGNRDLCTCAPVLAAVRGTPDWAWVALLGAK